jgi:hypothetical protein
MAPGPRAQRSHRDPNIVAHRGYPIVHQHPVQQPDPCPTPCPLQESNSSTSKCCSFNTQRWTYSGMGAKGQETQWLRIMRN